MASFDLFTNPDSLRVRTDNTLALSLSTSSSTTQSTLGAALVIILGIPGLVLVFLNSRARSYGQC